MEEVDKILILTLNQLGCDIDEDVKSVGSFGIGEVVKGVVRCIQCINNDTELPSSLPQNMAQRFRVAAAIAQAVKDVGYPGDIGYQSLLYPNETDLRKIFMFLIEKLPKDSAAVSDEPLNRGMLIHQEARKKLSEVLSQAWIPPLCRRVAQSCASRPLVTKYGTHHTRRFSSKPYVNQGNLSKVSPVLRKYYEHHARTVTDLVGYKYLIASLLDSHALQLEKERILPSDKEDMDTSQPIVLERLFAKEELPAENMGFSSRRNFTSSLETSKHVISSKEGEKEASQSTNFSTPEVGISTEEQIRLKREEQLVQLQKEISDINEKVKQCVEDIETAGTTLTKLTSDFSTEEKLKEEKASEQKMKQRTANLLPEAESNIQRLQAALKNSGDKMVRLQKQWEAHQQPLSEQLSQLSLEISGKKVNKEEVLVEMSDLRDKMRGMVQDAARKETAMAQLKSQFENMNKDISRSVYTKRIVDISAKVRKQKEEISRVLADTRTIQKEINTLSGKLERTFTVVEGTAYKEATNNERARQVYRAVAAVHEGCGELVDIVRETGSVQREISDLKEQVDLEKTKKVEQNLEQLKVDLAQVKKENASLKQQLL